MSYKKTVLKQYSQENTCVGVKKGLQHRCFPANIAKFLRGPILKHICKWQPLYFSVNLKAKWLELYKKLTSSPGYFSR